MEEAEWFGVGARIRAGREKAGMSQETLAEQLGVSRQAVSKWEMGTSVPSPENLRALSEALGIQLTDVPEGAGAEPSQRPWKQIALACMLACLLLAAVVWLAARGDTSEPEGTEVGEIPSESVEMEAGEAPSITAVTFFDTQGQRLNPDLGDNWLHFQPGSQVIAAVSFQAGEEESVYGVSLYLTPTGTETYELRQQLAVRSVDYGDGVALLLWDVPEDLLGHLEVVLECDGGQTYSQTFNVTTEE